jgi:hypothetical protein
LVQLGGRGNLEKSQRAAPDCKLFSGDKSRTFPWLLINRFAIVSTFGELVISLSKIRSSLRDGRQQAQQYQQTLQKVRQSSPSISKAV